MDNEIDTGILPRQRAGLGEAVLAAMCANLLNESPSTCRSAFAHTARPEETRRPSANRSSAWIGSFDGSPTVGLSIQAAL